jgi:hypothetical protein
MNAYVIYETLPGETIYTSQYFQKMQTENKGGKRTSRSMIPKEHWNVY